MEGTSISRLFRCWLHDFGSFGTFIPGNENAGGSAFCIHKDIVPEEAIVTHLITCQGRDHIVRQSLVIVNVHFEPELTLRQLRERLRLINPHWPSYPNAVGITLGDLNICQPGRPDYTRRDRLGWMWPFPFRRHAMYFLENKGSSLDLFSPNRRRESSNSNISRSSLTPTTFYVSRRCMERMSIFRLFRCWLRDFGSFGTFFIGNENAGGSGICIHRDLLSVEAIATHLVTCHGRDHLVNIQSGGHNLVIVNVHFEFEFTLRQLRGRLRLIHPHWLAYPNGVGIILGDFNICEPEEGRFNVWNQTFTDGDPRKTAMFHSFFPQVLEIAQPDYTRTDSIAVGIIRTLSRIDRMFINLPVAEARDFHCYSHVFENLVEPDHSE